MNIKKTFFYNIFYVFKNFNQKYMHILNFKKLNLLNTIFIKINRHQIYIHKFK
jgi:hypothetical protein